MLNLSPYINSRIASLRRTDEGERLKHQRKVTLCTMVYIPRM